jgi:hypothetical protein
MGSSLLCSQDPTNLRYPEPCSAVHTLISHFYETFLDIIYQSMSRSLHFIINLYKLCTYPSPIQLNN